MSTVLSFMQKINLYIKLQLYTKIPSPFKRHAALKHFLFYYMPYHLYLGINCLGLVLV